MLYSEFVRCVNHFLEISNIINDGWTLKNYKDNVYLVKSMIQWLEKNNLESKESDEEININSEIQVDNQCVNDTPLNFRKWEYHVVHSLSYQVPVIYFNVWNSSGQLLSLEELWSAVDLNFQSHIYNNKWFTLTQQEHPYLFKPFFHFHPCHTENFLHCFTNPQCNKLITWLSSIGQVIWLKLDPIYGKKCFIDK